MNTMTINEFKDAATKDIQASLGASWTTKEAKVAKNNRGLLTGITFLQEGECGGPTIYAEDIYDMYNEGMPYDDIIKNTVSGIQESYRINASVVSFFDNLDYEKAKTMLGLRIVDRELNEELLKSRIYKDHPSGLVLIADVNFAGGRCGIHPGLMEQFGVSEDTVFEDAIKNASSNNPAMLFPIESALFGGPEENLLEEAGPVNPNALYVLTNEEQYLGASVVMFPGVIEKISELYGGGFYLLPSSIHEVLITGLNMNPDELSRTIKEANGKSGVVSEDEILSNSLFVCRNGKLERVPDKAN